METKGDPLAGQGIGGDRNQSQYSKVAEAVSMLSVIPAEDRETWLRAGMALKSEFGDAGFSIWDEWSQTASNYNEKDARSVWRSFRGSGVTYATLVHIANGFSWSRESAIERVLPKPRPAPAPVKNTTRYALELYLSARFDNVPEHPYAINKGITHPGGALRGSASGRVIGKNADCIIVPIRDVETDKVRGVQCINPQGKKQTFGLVSGNGLLLGNTLDKKLIWYVCEGWASAYSVVFHHQNGNGVCACSFGKSNQETLAKKIAEVYQPERIVILEEVD